ncbi:hypothetical protein B0H19DRAFT_1256125 [Mycena capillaripes]|nr:hypothetical protein B0H19DRAFT_1256125 [Mycena capillaripes]
MAAERKGTHGPSSYEGKSLTDSENKVGWYEENITEISPEGRMLLEEYSGIPLDEILPHVLRVRDKAFAIWSYLCIGQVRFLEYTIPQHPYYGPTLERLRAGGNFLDAGCCFGQELRFLAWKEHIPGAQLYGFDLEPGFIEFGFELFRDKDKLGATLLSGDLLATPASDELAPLEGMMDVIHVASVLHVWAWEQMVQAAKRLVSLSRPQPGSIIVGNQMGSSNPGEYLMPTAKGVNYRHDPKSMERFWKQIGEETGTSWKVEAGMFISEVVKQNLQHSWAKVDPGMGAIWFMATRV